MKVNEIREVLLTGERALFKSKHLKVVDSVFEEGESPLKESADLVLENDIFRWKYPLWYCQNVVAHHVTLLDTARSGIWYTHNIQMHHCSIQAPKIFRRASKILLEDVHFAHAQETLWNCREITLNQVTVNGDYFAMNCRDIQATDLTIMGNYAFDGASDIEIDGAKIISKDAFWNCENVVVKNAVIVGEYLGWNSKNVTFINCTIESNQGLCYMNNVKLINCKVIHTDLAFEYSTAEATITTKVDSIKNPIKAHIQAASVDELILDDELIDFNQVKIMNTKGEKINV